ncbi:non-specific lipid transfer protein GPI-anchored 11-like [Miscanthus floridulus]|uniref:non-specific lipid transfer protein GPI-anchored 11-like n=1 Tax=Miscanthus floridulus TaxID=154761 RepID=UPI003458E59B
MAPSINIPIALLIAFTAMSLQPSPSAAFSFPPIVPCIPGLPRIPLFPCYEPPPQPAPPKEPTECRSHLMNMMPCAGFLTNTSVTAPSATCCDGFTRVAHEGAAICYCRVVNGDIGQLFPAPMNFTRMFALDTVCSAPFQLRALAKHCDRDGAPPMTLPGTPPSSSPP